MNRLTAQGIIAELSLAGGPRTSIAIVTEHPWQVINTFRDLKLEWDSAITAIKIGHGIPKITFKQGWGVLYVITEETARRTACLRGQLLAFVYLDYDLSPSTDFYRELAARTKEIIRA
ncbi:hypothetical protein [Nocardia africana]